MSGSWFARRSLTRALAAAALPVVVALAAPAAAEDERIDKRLWLTTGAKGPVKLDSFRELREDCAAPAPVVTVQQHPAFGKLTTAKQAAPGPVDAAGPFAACAGKKFAWTVVSTPVPAKGEGTDKAVIRVQIADGEATTYDVEIVFAKKLPAGKTNGLYEDR